MPCDYLVVNLVFRFNVTESVFALWHLASKKSFSILILNLVEPRGAL